jgi:uncharacterized protein
MERHRGTVVTDSEPGAIRLLPKPDRHHDVFVSHATEDGDVARKLAASLEASGWSVFLAARDLPNNLDANWSRRIDEALDRSGMLVLLVSPEALDATWVDYEWRSVHNDVLARRGGWLVPCCIRGPAPDQLNRALRHYQAVDLRSGQDWDAGFVSLVKIVEGYLKRPITAAPASAVRTVLSIQGAGARTVIATTILARLEAELVRAGGGQLVGHFDLIVGDSVGAALAARLAQGASVADAAASVRQSLGSATRRLRVRQHLSRYGSAKLIEAMGALFGETRLSAVPKCAISTFDLSRGRYRLWSGHPVLGGTPGGPLLARIVAASVAAPIYFDPIELDDADGSKHQYVDGGIWEGDPARVGLEAIRRLFAPSPLLGDIVLMSVGSGHSPAPRPKGDGVNLFNWISRLPDIAMTANRNFVHEHVETLFRDAGSRENYLRFDPVLPEDAEWSLGDLEAIPRFESFADQWVESRSEQILQAVQQVLQRPYEPGP